MSLGPWSLRAAGEMPLTYTPRGSTSGARGRQTEMGAADLISSVLCRRLMKIGVFFYALRRSTFAALYFSRSLLYLRLKATRSPGPRDGLTPLIIWTSLMCTNKSRCSLPFFNTGMRGAAVMKPKPRSASNIFTTPVLSVGRGVASASRRVCRPRGWGEGAR